MMTLPQMLMMLRHLGKGAEANHEERCVAEAFARLGIRHG